LKVQPCIFWNIKIEGTALHILELKTNLSH